MNGRLINEKAFQTAVELLGTVGNCLRPEEHRDAFEAFYQIVKRQLAEYETLADRMQQRLRPSRN